MPDAFDAVDQYVIVMMENRSFDHMLGYLGMQPWSLNREPVRSFPSAYLNTTHAGEVRRPFRVTSELLADDLPHGRRQIWTQLHRSMTQPHTFAMDGYVRAMFEPGEAVPAHPACMGFLTPACVPITHHLTTEFSVCDNWFTPIPSSTHPNRMVALCGWSPYDDTYTQLADVPCVLDFLSKHHVPWGVYARRASMFALMLNHTIDALRCVDGFEPWSRFESHWNAPVTGPRIWFLEPGYADVPWGAHPKEDDHPPLTCAPGQAFLREVYRTVRGNDERWKRTMMIIYYDEHGGFFDHHAPLPIRMAGPPVPHDGGSVWPDFPCTGPRVPSMLVSPWVDPGTTVTARFDHTSVLRTLTERFAPSDRDFFVDARGHETVFSRPVSTLGVALTRTTPRDIADTLPDSPNVPATPATPATNMTRMFEQARALAGGVE